MMIELRTYLLWKTAGKSVSTAKKQVYTALTEEPIKSITAASSLEVTRKVAEADNTKQTTVARNFERSTQPQKY